MSKPIEIEVPDTDFNVTFIGKRVVPYIAPVGTLLTINTDTPIYRTPDNTGAVAMTRKTGDVVKVEEYRNGYYCVWRKYPIELWMKA